MYTNAEQRRQEIFEIMKKDKRISVSDIKVRFGVSSVTANNDLIHLERQGFIDRHFGYSQLKENAMRLVEDEDVTNLDKKKDIAKRALGYIGDNESIFFYVSSSIHQLAKILPDKLNIIVVTNSSMIANELGERISQNTILLGGFYNPHVYATYGIQAIKQLSEYNIDKLFLSSNGVDFEKGVTIDEPFEAELNRALIKNAKQTILLADSTKIGMRKFISVCDISAINVLITNKDADQKEIDKIRGAGVIVDLV